ncbi:MAG: hypothetical protein JRE57_07490 [Deltaproteobacteria bacterium]|nr:hypothetical protein [Deltaproteobacteria bacterium]
MRPPGRRSWVRDLRAALCILLPSLLTGCASGYGYMGIIIPNLKFPITWEKHERSPVNQPLDGSVQEALLRRAHILSDGGDPDDLDEAFHCEVPRQGEGECLDPVHGPAEELGHTTVLVAVSGGGSRASIFAAYSMAFLEREYNRIAAHFRPDASAMIDLIDGFSTVSGGSIYAFHVARRLAGPSLEASSPEPLPSEIAPAISEHTLEPLADKLIPPISQGPLEPCALPSEMQRYDEERRGRYSTLCHTVEDRRPMRTLGTACFQSAFGYFGSGLPFAIFTDRGYVDHLARGLEFYEPFSLFMGATPLVNPFSLNPRFLPLGDLPPRPSFFFNATALETGSPFVLTQNVMNLPGGKLPRRATRIDLPSPHNQADDFRPLRHSLTLEEIGSSPGRFPLAYAAAASAAFPAGVEPLPVRRYDYRAGVREFEPTEAKLSLADGGIFDNSGMMTAADLFEYLAERKGIHELILITINADASEYDLAFKERVFPPRDSLPIRGRPPFSFLGSTADSLNLIHFINKRRGEEVAWRQLEALENRIRKRDLEADLNVAFQAGGSVWQAYQEQLGPIAPRVEKELSETNTLSMSTYSEAYQVLLGSAKNYIHYFPIGLAQLSQDDQDPIRGGDSLFQLVRQIGTSFWLKKSDEVLLEKAASMITDTEQEAGWPVGPNCPDAEEPTDVFHLGEAVAFALLRAGSGAWDDRIEADRESEWCRRQLHTRPELKESSPAPSENPISSD